MTHGKTLQDKLAKSLDRANKKTGTAQTVNPRASNALPSIRHCVKLSVSLFENDMTRINDICQYVLRHGHRIGTSQAVKLALRTAPLTEELITALEALKAEDGRKWQDK